MLLTLWRPVRLVVTKEPDVLANEGTPGLFLLRLWLGIRIPEGVLFVPAGYRGVACRGHARQSRRCLLYSADIRLNSGELK